MRVFEVLVDPGVYKKAHIPGATNLNWHTDLVDTVNRDIASREKLEAQLRKAGVKNDITVITYCRIGERSSHTWFALKRLLGYDARNYDGSWTEYGNAVGVPVVNKSGTVWLGK